MKELLPPVKTIAEICCGDCTRQFDLYSKHLDVRAYRGLDIEPSIVIENQKREIECYCGDALDKTILQKFTNDDVIFFGPPLSTACDGHQILQFDDVQPSYRDFANLLLGELNYTGILVCICPNTTTMGNIAKLHHQMKDHREKCNLPVIHYSYSTITGNDEPTELRLKYVELWFSEKHDDVWEVRESKPG
ncbi:MAG: hypothetical protein QM730_04135 [Anaerolineales bacterium]